MWDCRVSHLTSGSTVSYIGGGDDSAWYCVHCLNGVHTAHRID